DQPADQAGVGAHRPIGRRRSRILSGPLAVPLLLIAVALRRLAVAGLRLAVPLRLAVAGLRLAVPLRLAVAGLLAGSPRVLWRHLRGLLPGVLRAALPAGRLRILFAHVGSSSWTRSDLTLSRTGVTPEIETTTG